MNSPEPRVVISFPCLPSKIADVISDFMPEKSDPFTTDDAFKHIAIRAKDKLVLMSPFMDLEGVQWVSEIFSVSDAKRKILICPRDKRFEDVAASVKHLASQLDFEAWQFAVVHPAESRALPIESFHSKIALADRTVAYVGSANLTGHSRNVSLECGVIVEGPAARKVSGVIDAVLSLSTKINF